MKKKSKADVAKMVDAQSKGRKVRGAQTDKKTPEGGELDTRKSKYMIIEVQLNRRPSRRVALGRDRERAAAD